MSEARKRKNRRLKQAKEEVRKLTILSALVSDLVIVRNQNTDKLWGLTI